MRRATRSLGPVLRQLVTAEGPGASWAALDASTSTTWALPPSTTTSPCSNQHPAFASVRHASFMPSWWDKSRQQAINPESSVPTPGSSSDTPAEQPSFWPLQEDSYDAYRAIGQAVGASDVACIASAKADAFFTSAWVMGAVQYLHDTQGLPWWGAIAALNIVTKVCTFPLALLSQKAAAQTVETQSQMAHIGALQQAAKTASTPEESQRIQQAAKNAYAEFIATKGSPFKSMMKVPAIMLANMTVFLSVFNGVRSLMASQAYTLNVGGTLWFPDLTTYDQYYGLPILCAVSTILMVSRGMNIDGMAVSDTQLGQRKLMKYFLYGAALMFIPAGSWVPAGVGVLWVSNSCFSVMQGTLMRNDSFRRLVGLPSLAEMRETNRRIAAQQAAAMAPASAVTPSAYDPSRAAAELQAKIQKDAQGKPVLFTQNPNAGKRKARR